MSGAGILREERIGGQRLLLGDCLQVMPTLGRFDAVVTDPPYGIAYVHGAEKRRHASAHNEKPIRGDDRPFDPAPFLDARAILWGANHFAARLPGGGRWLVWDKRDGVGFNDQSDIEMAWMSGERRADRIFSHLWSGYSKASERGVARVHPTQKPVAVMEWCLGFLPNARTILDPFMGSGTTLVACQRMGRHGTGIELDPEYFEIACRRVDEAARQPDLLIPETRGPAPVQEGFDL